MKSWLLCDGARALAGHFARQLGVVAGAVDDDGRHFLVIFFSIFASDEGLTTAAALEGFLRSDAGEQGVGVWLEDVEVELMALLDGGGEAVDAEVELGVGDFFAAFLLVDLRVVAADGRRD